jgi:hypothetical protein
MTPCRLNNSPLCRRLWHLPCHPFVCSVHKALFRFQFLFLSAITTPQTLVVFIFLLLVPIANFSPRPRNLRNLTQLEVALSYDDVTGHLGMGILFYPLRRLKLFTVVHVSRITFVPSDFSVLLSFILTFVHSFDVGK